MMNDAYFTTAESLGAKGFEGLPNELKSSAHLIYSSPAALAFNSPGAEGFGVKRAGLAVPNSVMLLVSPACCGRNTTLVSRIKGYEDRFFFLLLDDTDIVTGRHLAKIPNAVDEVVKSCEKRGNKPLAVMICITCVDALLGTDMERVCRKSNEKSGVPVVPCYMYALTREKRLPPMAAVRKSVYSLLKPQKKVSTSMNIMGYFAPLHDDCELYTLLHEQGIKEIREISRCESFEEYMKMSSANFNLVLNTEARYAAQEMERELNIPSIELTRLYRIDKIKNQYRLLGQALGVNFDDEKYYLQAKNAVEDFKKKHEKVRFSVGEMSNCDPLELSLALIEYGFEVPEIFCTAGERNFVFVKKIAEISPNTKIYSNLSTSMIFYKSDENIDICIGKDAAYYHSGECSAVYWNEDSQPFGYEGVKTLFARLDQSLENERRGRK